MNDISATSSQQVAPADKVRGKSRGRRWWSLRIAALAVLLFIGGIIIFWWQLRAVPAYMAEHQAFIEGRSRQELAALSQQVGNRISSQLTSVQMVNGRLVESDNDIRELHITMDEMRAWIAMELIPWLRNQNVNFPSEITQPGVAIINEQIVLFAMLNVDGYEQNLSVFFSGHIRKDGQAWLKIDRVRAGNVPMPAEKLTGLFDEQDIARAFEGFTFDPTFRIGNDERRWRPISFQIQPQAVIMQVKVIPSTHTPKKP